MNKKILSIIFSLFLVGVFSVSCSNSDKTGSTIDDSKGIEQFNGNTYVSKDSFDGTSVGLDKDAYLWISIKDGKAATLPSNDNTTEPSYLGYFSVTGAGTDYSFSLSDSSGTPNSVVGTLKFSSDGSSVTINYSKNTDDKNEIMLNKDIVCNKKQ
ncbi:hypothetical protein R4M03_08445 [Brachyspira pilosicoli]|uniref:Lipoprotein n=2 Tax=Brachyspira pilosicoli TaxID=52584 RepID=A0A3B6VNR2_BRAPL|nr:hypothetical protein [Brachyspira pilosicoli]AGA67368.1 hypothetical protein BPP43_11040 [Brachyspira pilosicoli P43/6/78]WIH90151.1 hypothetical protein NEI02_10645 [Brachyspira pilosicoli]WIH92442.1 hypothetical protein NEI01_10620 [Brachyspira pilosicoli]WIH94734.1 hypothetical protein NEH99_10615 [Brachyspira pilosicoli]